MDPNLATNEPVYERLAYETALRALDKQERLIDELRSRTGLLLAAASLAASFLGREAFAGDPKRGLAILALGAFLLAVGASVYVLLPKTGKFIFAMVGAPDCTRGSTNLGTTLARSIDVSRTTSTASGMTTTSSCRSCSARFVLPP